MSDNVDGQVFKDRAQDHVARGCRASISQDYESAGREFIKAVDNLLIYLRTTTNPCELDWTRAEIHRISELIAQLPAVQKELPADASLAAPLLIIALGLATAVVINYIIRKVK